MLEGIFLFVVALHGVIHLLGFTEAFGLTYIGQFDIKISRAGGMLWFSCGMLFIVSALLFFLGMDLWQYSSLIAIVISQYLIFGKWKDAKYGTLVNAILLAAVIFNLGGLSFNKKHEKESAGESKETSLTSDSLFTETNKPQSHILYYVFVDRNVSIRDYFAFMDSMACTVDSTLHINEYVLLHANSWILDSLKATDYYSMKARGIILRDQPKYIILHKGDRLVIPDSLVVFQIYAKLDSTILDVNIPEFMLRIVQGQDTILTCKVRVGRDAKEYLAVAKHIVNLRTPIGKGKVVRIAEIPYVLNPDTGEKYDSTCRDDGNYTKMPVIPWLEPSINGIRYGAMIHPTTNPETLGSPYSHGCIGTNEADAWTIYANAPIGTRVIFRYNLHILNRKGDTVKLRDIYGVH